MRSVLIVLAALCLVACPPNDKTGDKGEKKSDPLGPAQGGCTKVGQNCEVSPGKLGTCVLKDNCTSSTCFVCQSQH